MKTGKASDSVESGERGCGDDTRLSLRRTEAARALGISLRHLDALIKSGRIPCIRLGAVVVIPVAQLKHWLAKAVADKSQGGEA